MNSHDTSRITDVVPANFLCDKETIQKIADSQLSDEKALYLVEDNIPVLESRRRRLKDELKSVERLLSEAVAEQTRLRSSIESHKSLLVYSPIRTLPGEVLSEIFLYYIALSRPAHGTVFQEIVACHRAPAPILQVCRRWRTTALEDPRLWTTIPFIGSGEDPDEEDLNDEESKSFAHPMLVGSPQERAAYWTALESRLQRTSSLPLQLLLNFGEHRSDNLDDTIASLQTFIRLWPRADTISVHVHALADLAPEVTSVMLDADIPRADRVHSARIEGHNSTFKRKLLSAIPNVEVLDVDYIDLRTWFFDVRTAGQRLRCLNISRNNSFISLAELLRLLDRAPLLETLEVSRISVGYSVETLHPVTHLLLSTFSTHYLSMQESDAIFGHLTLPALRSLSFGERVSYYLWPRSSTMAFLQRSGCMFTELAFRRCSVDVECFTRMITAQNRLTTLQLNLLADGTGGGEPITMPVLELLSVKPKDASPHLLPALTVLRVSVLPRQLKAVQRLIQSRFAAQAKECGVATLREVGIEVQIEQRQNEVEMDEHAALFKAFTDKGMMIQISHRPLRR